MPYLFTHHWKQERERLASIEALIDPFTIQCLEAIGVAPGWRCLEVGAGAGSVAKWLCRQVGPAGSVVATDVETEFLDAIKSPGLEVRSHDVSKDSLDPASFDLVHARKVVEHLQVPFGAVQNMALAVKPGGWLFIEAGDSCPFLHLECRDPKFFEYAFSKFIQAMDYAGLRPHLGRELGQWLRQLGYRQVNVEGRTEEWSGHGDSPLATLHRLTFQRLRDRVIQEGLLTAKEADQVLSDMQHPDFHAISYISFAAWGQKPGGPAARR